jgi:hypothetical protein
LADLQEYFETRRAENKTDEDILRELFEENPAADCSELVKITGMDKLKIGRIKGQVMRWKKKHDAESGAPPPPGEDDEKEEGGLYKGEADTNKILLGILKSYPDIKPKHVDEVMDWAKLKGSLSPSEVISVLSGLRGIDYKTAYMISTKYSLALAKEAQDSSAQPTIFPGAPNQRGQGQWPLFDGRQPFSQPFTFDYSRQGGGSPQGYLTRDDLDRWEKDRQEKDRLSKLEDNVKEVGANVATMLDGFKKDMEGKLQAQAPSTADVEVEEVPIDKDGNICDTETMFSLKRITRPIGHKRESDPVADALKIIKVVKGETPATPVESPAVVAMQKDMEGMKDKLKETADALKKASEKLEEEKDKRVEERNKHLEDSIKDLKDSVGRQQAASLEGGIGQAIHEIAQKKPMDALERIFSPPGVPAASPGEVTTAEEPLAKELGKKGLVTIVRERRGA